MGLSIQVGYLADAISKDSEEVEIAFSSIKLSGFLLNDLEILEW